VRASSQSGQSGRVAADEIHPRVGATALGAALMRAQESVQPDALIKDPYAAAFVAAAPRPFDDIPDPDGELAKLEAAFRADVAIRTRFFDDFVTTACTSGIRQVVLLAAGLDARAFRLPWPPGTHLFEIDLPDVLDFKDAILGRERAHSRCKRRVMPIDLRDDWPAALLHAGFRPSEPTAWTAEGLLAYLTPEDVLRLLDRVGRLSAVHSELAFEDARTSDDSVLAQASELASMDEVAPMWHDGTGVDAVGWLDEHEWSVSKHGRDLLARRYGRDPGPTTAGFVTATLMG
jgi:methyltransferase (TIGR00027 family)